MQHPFKSIIKATLCALLSFGFAAQSIADDKNADPTGTWTWTTPGRNGGPERKSTMKVKVEGEKVTGKISSPGRDGAVNEIEITEGQVKGAELTFTVVREVNGNKFTQKYNGKIEKDVIKGKVAFERNGEAQSRDWEAKRETDKK